MNFSKTIGIAICRHRGPPISLRDGLNKCMTYVLLFNIHWLNLTQCRPMIMNWTFRPAWNRSGARRGAEPGWRPWGNLRCYSAPSSESFIQTFLTWECKEWDWWVQMPILKMSWNYGIQFSMERKSSVTERPQFIETTTAGRNGMTSWPPWVPIKKQFWNCPELDSDSGTAAAPSSVFADGSWVTEYQTPMGKGYVWHITWGKTFRLDLELSLLIGIDGISTKIWLCRQHIFKI